MKKSLLVIFFSALFLLFGTPVFAAETAFRINSSNIQVGTEFETWFYLDTNNQDINAIEGKIRFSENLFKLKEIKEGNSIVSLWIEQPELKGGEINFSGIIPGGYSSKRGLIFSMVFETKEIGQGAVNVQSMRVLLNDGKGTDAKVDNYNLQLDVFEKSQIYQPQSIEKEDMVMPEAFTPIITSDPAIFNGKHFLVFAAQDKGSGIEKYLINETRWPDWQILGKNWKEAESPYQLKDQKLKSFIYIRAIDKSENERLVTIGPRYSIKWYEDWRILGIITLELFVLVIISKILWRKKSLKRL